MNSAEHRTVEDLLRFYIMLEIVEYKLQLNIDKVFFDVLQ